MRETVENAAGRRRIYNPIQTIMGGVGARRLSRREILPVIPTAVLFALAASVACACS